MSREKGRPTHIVNRKASHPAKQSKLIQIIEQVPDPRGPSCNFKHPLTTMLFITIVTSLCGADNWVEIEALGFSLQSWIGQFVDVKEGIPSHYTFDRVFSLIDPSKMNEMMMNVMDLLRSKKEGDTVAFDGKSLRGTREGDLNPIHLLNAWSVENGICIGHIKVDDKTNEIKALPELMNLLDLKGTIITADAMNTQKTTAAKALEKKADYVLPVKGNQPGLLEEIELSFDEAFKRNFVGIDADSFETVEKSHGRVETRTYHVIAGDELPSAKEWPGLKSIGRVSRERTEGGKTSCEVIFYVSSCEIDAKLFGRCIRDHWGVENRLHWSLDVVFREDKLRYRDRIGASNLASVRKIVLGALAKDSTLKCGKAAKRLVAATDPAYRERILKTLF